MYTDRLKLSKLGFYAFLVYYVFDIYLSKIGSIPFIFGLKYGVQFDWVSIAGVFAILHLIFLFLELPVIFFLYKAHRWAQKVTFLYLITATVFYSSWLYCILAGNSTFTFFNFAAKGAFMFIFNMVIFVYLMMNFIVNNRKYESDTIS